MAQDIEIADTCSGHGRCYVLSPALFAPDDEGFALVLKERLEGDDDLQAAERAVQACPEGAVLMRREV